MRVLSLDWQQWYSSRGDECCHALAMWTWLADIWYRRICSLIRQVCWWRNTPSQVLIWDTVLLLHVIRILLIWLWLRLSLTLHQNDLISVVQVTVNDCSKWYYSLKSFLFLLNAVLSMAFRLILMWMSAMKSTIAGRPVQCSRRLSSDRCIVCLIIGRAWSSCSYLMAYSSRCKRWIEYKSRKANIY